MRRTSPHLPFAAKRRQVRRGQGSAATHAQLQVPVKECVKTPLGLGKNWAWVNCSTSWKWVIVCVCTYIYIYIHSVQLGLKHLKLVSTDFNSFAGLGGTTHAKNNLYLHKRLYEWERFHSSDCSRIELMIQSYPFKRQLNHPLVTHRFMFHQFGFVLFSILSHDFVGWPNTWPT
jgi:hypothetical protein